MAKKALNTTIKDRTAVMQKAREARAANPQKGEIKKRKRLQGRRKISRNESYPVEEFLKRTGLSQQAWRDARVAGLGVKKLGDSYWITGEEWFRWLEAMETTS